MLFLISVGIVYLFQLASFIMSIPRLMDMYRFYTHLLGIPDVSFSHAYNDFKLMKTRQISKLYHGQRSSDSLAKFGNIILLHHSQVVKQTL